MIRTNKPARECYKIIAMHTQALQNTCSVTERASENMEEEQDATGGESPCDVVETENCESVYILSYVHVHFHDRGGLCEKMETSCSFGNNVVAPHLVFCLGCSTD